MTNFRSSLSAAALMSAAVAITSPLPVAAQANHEITVTISEVKALDRADTPIGRQADFYARITIAGETFRTKFVRNQDVSKPNWQVSKRVPAGKHNVKLEIFDHDALKADDLIDINRLKNKRDLDFTLDTKSCRVTGFSGGYRCKSAIKRSGDDKKKAEVTFSVDVKR